jgi:hypothetical protein
MSLAQDAWFSTLGAPLGEGELEDIRAYLRGFGLAAPLPPLLVSSWDEAAEIVRRPALDWWSREETERARLEQTVQLDPADPEWVKLNDVLHGAAAVAAARFGYAHADMIKVAAGSASFAAYHRMLATGAGQSEDHPFNRKYALFAGGRWPLGVYGERFAIF